jgi:hypothetical protein
MSKPVPNCPVPRNQQPLYEYNSLKSTIDFPWTHNNLTKFTEITIKIFITLNLIWGLILSNNYSHEDVTLKDGLIILTTSSVSTTLILTRYYLGWKYIYNRLMQAAITYEESGWYDGQIWIKTTEMLLQDRLIGTYEVLPTLQRLKTAIHLFIGHIVLSLLLFKYIIK